MESQLGNSEKLSAKLGKTQQDMGMFVPWNHVLHMKITIPCKLSVDVANKTSRNGNKMQKNKTS